jgi:hypothetical protein
MIMPTLQKKDDPEKISNALAAITVKAGQVKTAQRIYPIMFHYLDDMIKEAKAKKILIDQRLEAEGAGPFAKELKLIKQVTVDKPWHFVFAPGKPAGFVVSKLPIKKDDIEAAHKMRGQKGVFHSGDIYFDQGKYILSIESRPPFGPCQRGGQCGQAACQDEDRHHRDGWRDLD